MPLQTASTSLSPQDAYNLIRSNAAGVKSQAQNALGSLQGGSVTSDFIFRMLDQRGSIIAALNLWKVVAGLDSYAKAQPKVGILGPISSSAVAVFLQGIRISASHRPPTSAPTKTAISDSGQPLRAMPSGRSSPWWVRVHRCSRKRRRSH